MEGKPIYPATFEKDGNYILVKFPDLPEAFTQGNSMKQAYEKAEEVLGLVLEERHNIPEASMIEKVRLAFPDKQVLLISLDITEKQKKNH